MSKRGLRFSIDRGGTFTDIYAENPDTGEIIIRKLLSVDPKNYQDAPTEGIRRILQEVTMTEYPKNKPVDSTHIQSIRMGTTVATNALLERKGEPCCLVITKGFRDLLYIGNQSRPKIFDLEISRPKPIYEAVIEARERIVLAKNYSKEHPLFLNDYTSMVGITGEELFLLEKLDVENLRIDLQNVFNSGIKSIAVLFMHSYLWPEHEKMVENLAKEIGFTQISLSSSLMPMVKIVPRGYTACVDAYLTPCIQKYLAQFLSGFDDQLLSRVRVQFMQSDGGLASVDNFTGFRAIISGPAGGVVGYSSSTYDPVTRQPLIGFDMGGTSTDVSRFAGEYEHVFETQISGCTIMAPQLDVNTVAAGGGSRLFFQSGLFKVGPESASAHPGPSCYKKSGPLTITDANLVLGRLIPKYFPHIFGDTQDQPLDVQASLDAFKLLQENINSFLLSNGKTEMTIEEIASGFIDVANESMCRPIRALTQAKGYDISSHCLSVFGGAGGQHACSIARSLGMNKIIIHRYAGVLSAYGMSLADVVWEGQKPVHKNFDEKLFGEFNAQFLELCEQAKLQLCSQGFEESHIRYQRYLNLRYDGTDTAMMVSTANNEMNFVTIFKEKYQQEYGFTLDRNIIVDDIRVRAIGSNNSLVSHKLPTALTSATPADFTSCYFASFGWCSKVPVYFLPDLLPLHIISGPCVIMNSNNTIIVEPNCVATISNTGDVVIEVPTMPGDILSTSSSSPVQLAIFSHRFMSIAEQMGRTLQRTAISTNIKERLDFSCALFGPNGDLVANAPHLPVHLGSMQEAVKFQVRHVGSNWKKGMVLMSNHPVAGGSHLPDITVITPVFADDAANDRPVFFVASRGHHADIGGIQPGSMPPFSKSLSEEGAAILSFCLVNQGVFDEAGITAILTNPGKSSNPLCTGTRNLSDNLSDLKAQVAANNKGIQLMQELITQYTLPIVQAYMTFIQHNAELAVRDMLRAISGQVKSNILSATDYLDDGTPICLKITIDPVLGGAIFDFTGTGTQVYANLNAPRAVTYSAIIYCLRCLVKTEIPLNQGCLVPIQVIIPEGSILSPSKDAAVVGGNVLTSQRVTDVILKAFQACAASCGCMNNFTCGNKKFGYYETICGGAGAGPTWHGQSGVHTHMTNTRITDPEIVERRYPIVLRTFSLRSESGGDGYYKGGDGVIREMEFLDSLELGILSERRSFVPYGMHGGSDAKPGFNFMIRAASMDSDEAILNLGAKNTYSAIPGDRIRILTPGGGGYGTPVTNVKIVDTKQHNFSHHDLPTGTLSNYTMTQEQC